MEESGSDVIEVAKQGENTPLLLVVPHPVGGGGIDNHTGSIEKKALSVIQASFVKHMQGGHILNIMVHTNFSLRTTDKT